MAKLQFKRASELPERWILPTGSYSINRALGGGLESGRFHVFWGPKASTKSTQSLYTIANAQQMGKKCLFVDAEKTFDERYAKKCGTDVDELLILDEGSNVAEDLLTAVLPALDKNDVDVMVIDSLSSILQGSFFEKPEANPMAIYSRSAKFVLAKLLNAMHRDSMIILISHASIDLSGFKPQSTAQMGSAQGHWTSNIIGFKANNGSDNFRKNSAGELDGYRKVAWKFDKTKQPVWPFNGEYYFKGVTGHIDNNAEIFGTAVECDVFEKSGAWYKFDDKSYRETQLVEMMNNDTDFASDVVKAIDLYDARFRSEFAKTVDDSIEIEDDDA
jgi:recombination protein RecA